MVARIQYDAIDAIDDSDIESGHTFNIEEENENLRQEELNSWMEDFNQPLGRELEIFFNLMCSMIILSICLGIIYSFLY
jgi:hypothetical protein